MLTRAQKEEQVAELRDKFARATSVIVADYRGISVDAVNQLRGKLYGDGSGEMEYQVIKNSVLRLAAKDGVADGISELFNGPSAVAISYGDPVALAKILVDYSKEHEVFELRGGILDGRAINQGEIGTLATLPSLDELRGQLVGLLMAPAGKLARLLNEPGGQMARLIAARRDSLGGDAA